MRVDGEEDLAKTSSEGHVVVGLSMSTPQSRGIVLESYSKRQEISNIGSS